MENINYKVNRDDVHVGSVIYTDMSRIYRVVDDYRTVNSLKGKLTTNVWKTFRNMLFVPTEDKYCDDLLFNSKKYPILNMTDDDKVLSLEGDQILISDACNLSLLLQHFDYADKLGYEDLLRIRNTFFTGRFAMDNCELFGFTELFEDKDSDCIDGRILDFEQLSRLESIFYEDKDSDCIDGRILDFEQLSRLESIFYEDKDSDCIDGRILDFEQLSRLESIFYFNELLSKRSFVSNGENVLPYEYWHALDSRGDQATVNLLTHEIIRRDMFEPPFEEGPVKTLKK